MTPIKVISRFFIVLIVGGFPILGICSKISLAFDDHRHANGSSSAHDQQSDVDHDHAEVHCPPVELFVPSPSFSLKPNSVLERMSDSFVPALIFHRAYGEFHRLLHGPPVLARFNGTPSHLFFSVLRI